MRLKGYLDDERVVFELDEAGRLVVSFPGGMERYYNDETYDGDSWDEIRQMLLQDGVQLD